MPDHATVVGNPGLWMASEAVEELARAAMLRGCLSAVGMPDLSPGSGTPVGVALAFSGIAHPQLLGSDAGCGVQLLVTKKTKTSADKLERRLARAFETAISEEQGASPGHLARAAWLEGPAGLSRHSIDPSIAELAAHLGHSGAFAMEGRSGPEPRDLCSWERQLGTIGGGNHFAEIAHVTKLFDRDAAASFGLNLRRVVTLVHSGSRGVGHAVALTWKDPIKDEPHRSEFLAELAGACRFAQTNRFLLSCRLLSALGCTRPDGILHAVDLIHNGIEKLPATSQTESTLLHRKGATPAKAGALAVVLGTRGSRTWLVEGTGNPLGLDSVAHGAGRRMNRNEALAKMKAKHRRKSLRRTRLGSRVVCDRKDLLFEEHPEVYKDVDTVAESLFSAGLARPIAVIEPLFTVKR